MDLHLTLCSSQGWWLPGVWLCQAWNKLPFAYISVLPDEDDDALETQLQITLQDTKYASFLQGDSTSHPLIYCGSKLQSIFPQIHADFRKTIKKCHSLLGRNWGIGENYWQNDLKALPFSEHFFLVSCRFQRSLGANEPQIAKLSLVCLSFWVFLVD